jgi:ATP-dependent protease ClpP protease subunit
LYEIGGPPWASGFSAADFAGQLAGVRGPLDVHISSSGGDVFQGLSIYSALTAYGKGPVTTYCDGLAASIASVIMQAGQRRVMAPGSVLMLHDAWAVVDGNQADMESMAATLGKLSDNIASVYASRAGGTVAYWRDVMRAETWYTAEEAVAAGLADEVAGQAAQMPASAVTLAARAPARIAARLREADEPLKDVIRKMVRKELVRQWLTA